MLPRPGHFQFLPLFATGNSGEKLKFPGLEYCTEMQRIILSKNYQGEAAIS